MPRLEGRAVWVLGKYLALQLPGWAITGAALIALREWGALGTGTAIGLWTLWVAKDFALYPLLRHAYGNAPGRHVGADPLLGAPGIVEDELAPEGRVRVRGELWGAELLDRSAPPVSRGTAVRVRELRGLTLRVEPEP